MNIIEFSTREDYLLAEEDKPIPTKLNIPEWFKKLKHTKDYVTVKGCMPFMETLTTGYLLKLPQDIDVKYKIEVINPETKEKKIDSFIHYSLRDNFETFNSNHYERLNLNYGYPSERHNPKQLEGNPLLKKQENTFLGKIMNPWIIKTPPGYSCLFIPPLNNADDRFSIIPGIVETDVYNTYINFPYVINGDKYKTLDTVLNKGIPYVQIIPFKKESWKMKITSENEQKKFNTNLKIHTRLIRSYKDFFWRKIKWE